MTPALPWVKKLNLTVRLKEESTEELAFIQQLKKRVLPSAMGSFSRRVAHCVVPLFAGVA